MRCAVRVSLSRFDLVLAQNGTIGQYCFHQSEWIVVGAAGCWAAPAISLAAVNNSIALCAIHDAKSGAPITTRDRLALGFTIDSNSARLGTYFVNRT